MVDKPWWTKNNNKKFLTKSAWELLRQRAFNNENLEAISCKGLPFKYFVLT